jgi:hypothetical protein
MSDDIFAHAPQQARIRDKAIARDKRNAWRDDAKGVSARFRLQHGHLPEFIASEIARGTGITDYAEGLTKCIAHLIATFAINTSSPGVSAIRFLRELVEETKVVLEGCQEGGVEGSFIIVDKKTGDIVDADLLAGLKQ